MIFDRHNERGNGEAPSEPIDVDAIEEQYLTQLVAQQQEPKEYEKQFVKGKRFRNDPTLASRKPEARSFWI